MLNQAICSFVTLTCCLQQQQQQLAEIPHTDFCISLSAASRKCQTVCYVLRCGTQCSGNNRAKKKHSHRQNKTKETMRRQHFKQGYALHAVQRTRPSSPPLTIGLWRGWGGGVVFQLKNDPNFYTVPPSSTISSPLPCAKRFLCTWRPGFL